MTARPGWYADGLRFGCTQCGECCTGAPGYVWVSPRDEAAIARHLGIEREEFRRRYTRLVGAVASLVEKPNGDCVFLSEDRRCTIQPVKPRQCLTYPFWPRLLASRETWQEEARKCPGMNQGPLFRAGDVDRLADRETPREDVCRIFRSARAPS